MRKREKEVKTGGEQWALPQHSAVRGCLESLRSQGSGRSETRERVPVRSNVVLGWGKWHCLLEGGRRHCLNHLKGLSDRHGHSGYILGFIAHDFTVVHSNV